MNDSDSASSDTTAQSDKTSPAALAGWSPRSLIVLGVIYVLFMSGMIATLMWTRHSVLTNADPQAVAKWQEWVEEAKRQSKGDGPVKRRPPKSDVPPAYVLMQDFLPICVFATFIFGSALFITFAYLIRGALKSPGRGVIESTEDHSNERSRAAHGEQPPPRDK